MKRLFSILAISGLFLFGTVQAQESDSIQTSDPAVEPVAEQTPQVDLAAEDAVESSERSFTQ